MHLVVMCDRNGFNGNTLNTTHNALITLHTHTHTVKCRVQQTNVHTQYTGSDLKK